MTQPRMGVVRSREWLVRRRDPADKIEALTTPQRDILQAFALGLTAEEIAQQRGCTAAAIRKQIGLAYERLGLPSGSIARACYLLGHYQERRGEVVRSE